MAETRWSRMLPPAPLQAQVDQLKEYATYKFPDADPTTFFSKDQLRAMKEVMFPAPKYVIKIFRTLPPGESPRAETRDGMNFEIFLTPGQYKSAAFTNLTDDLVLAHELGHIIGTICKLPGSVGDWRSHRKGVMPEHQGEIESEIEAWDTAKEIMLAAFETARKEAIESYHQAARERKEEELRNAILGRDIMTRWSSPYAWLDYKPGEE